MNEPTILDTGKDILQPSGALVPAPYIARARAVVREASSWPAYRFEVVERCSERVLGGYDRNYAPLRTFHPFKLRDQWLALWSGDYTATRIMRLPDCEDLGGEEACSEGFCPADFFVPALRRAFLVHEESCPKRMGGGACQCDARVQYEFPERIHGFVAGCLWGDDGTYKIEYLDLSRADEGILVRSARFGYIAMPDALNLDKAVQMYYGPEGIGIDIAIQRYYDFESGIADE